jgi:C1A family cysteine protease
MSNPLAYVRTYAPIIAGAILTWLIGYIPIVANGVDALAAAGIDRTAIIAVLAAIIMGLYYAIARWLGKYWPTIEAWMLGSSSQPTYVSHAITWQDEPTTSTAGGYGWHPDLPDARDHHFTPATMKLPATVDLRPICPPVYDQGQLGSCTANAIAAAYDVDRGIQKLEFMGPSRLFIYYNERALEGTIRSDAGAQIRDGIKTLKIDGVAPETMWPYQVSKFAKQPPADAYADALENEALSYARVSATQAAIQTVLANGRPIVIGFTVYESFESAKVAKTGIMPMPAKGEKVLGGHAVLVVGYKKIGAKLYWIVRNSWGASWGVGGYFYMPAEYLTTKGLASDFWVVQSVENTKAVA